MCRDCAERENGADRYGLAARRAATILAIISRSKTHITLSFARCTEFEDSHGLREGVGKTTRHVKLKNPDTVNADALRDDIRQALALDKE